MLQETANLVNLNVLDGCVIDHHSILFDIAEWAEVGFDAPFAALILAHYDDVALFAVFVELFLFLLGLVNQAEVLDVEILLLKFLEIGVADGSVTEHTLWWISRANPRDLLLLDVIFFGGSFAFALFLFCLFLFFGHHFWL